MRDLKAEAKKYANKLSKIKLILLDCDGILTDGTVYWAGEEVGFNRHFNISDGYGIRMMILAGKEVGIISGGNSKGLHHRIDNLGIKHAYLGREDKREAYLDVQQKLNLKDEEILYMGDELFDIPLLKKAGFSATVSHAVLEVQEVVDYVTEKESGQGAVREVIDMLRYVQGIEPNIPDFD